MIVQKPNWWIIIVNEFSIFYWPNWTEIDNSETELKVFSNKKAPKNEIQIICTKKPYHGINMVSTLIAAELRSNRPIIKLGTLNFKKWLKFALKFSPKNAIMQCNIHL
jgi:hypothetical protein